MSFPSITPSQVPSSGEARESLLRLHHLSLINYRCFDHLEVVLEYDLTVLTAQNGGGKTAILDAIALLVYPFVADFAKYNHVPSIDSIDARRVRSPLGSMVSQTPTRLTVQGMLGNQDTLWSRELLSVQQHSTSEGASPLVRWSASLQQALQEYSVGRIESPPALPLIAYYGTGRLWREDPLSKPKGQRLDEQSGAYINCLRPSARYETFQRWFEAMSREAQAEQAGGTPSPHRPQQALAAVRRAVDAILQPTGWHRLGWDFVAGEIVAEHPSLGRLPVSSLSDGVRGVLSMAADLAHRAFRLNPQDGEEAPARASGVVLIDEVDLHLHPAWQQQILASLQRAFPRVQLVVSTHSPQVLSTVSARQIRVLDVDGVSTPRQQTRGVRSPDVLAAVMGVDPAPDVSERQDLLAYRALIQDGSHESPEGLRLREKLEAHFGPQHPEILDNDRLIRFQRLRLRPALPKDGSLS